MAQTYMINELYFMCEKQGRKNSKTIYRALINGSTIKLKSPKLYIPFGGELYNGKMLLNFELDPEKNNECHNFFAKLSQIDIALRDILNENTDEDDDQCKIKNIPQELIDDIKDKEFISCIRNGKNGYILRTHVKNGTTPYSHNKENHYTFTQIKGTYAYIELELHSVWTSKTSYGYVLYVTDINIS